MNTPPATAPNEKIEIRLQPLLLVIDDEPLVHTVLKRSLPQAGFQYCGAVDGDEGLAMARARVPDAILLDVNMPALDGRDVLCALKADPMLRDVPVVVITGRADHLSRLPLLEAGAVEVIEKPFDVPMLQRRVAWILEKQRSRVPN